MTLLPIDPASDTPPFEQVRLQVAGLVADGELAAGEKLPTVRQLAADLGLAANTVARAYRELETDGVIVTQGRRGTFVASSLLDAGQTTPTGSDARAAAEAYAVTARRLGLSLVETTRLVESAWSRGARPSGP